MYFLQLIKHVLQMACAMSWEMFWPIVLGLLLSAAIQSRVSRPKVAQVLGQTTSSSIVLSAASGAASSSCSYAAVALARALFQKGATLTNAMVFEFSSTNLVFDLGVVIFALLGWQFLAAQYFGAILMIIILSLLFKFTLTAELETSARKQAQRSGTMEGHVHAAAPMNVSHYFCMDLFSLLPDLLTGIFAASLLAVIVPGDIWAKIFLTGNPELAFFLGPIVGPIISMLSFVCSIGNVPLALVLWHSGISFGGVISFIFADLLILPILNIYRKYYGRKTAVYLFIISYTAIVLSGAATELVFSFLGLIPPRQVIQTLEAMQLHLKYTAIFNAAAFITAIILSWRFFTAGGASMLKRSNGSCCSTTH